MGISLIDSILVLIAATCFALIAYFVGHALSSGEAWAWMTAGLMAGVAGGLGYVVVRRFA